MASAVTARPRTPLRRSIVNRNVSLSFELEIALLGVAAVVALQRALNVDGCVSCPSIRLL